MHGEGEGQSVLKIYIYIIPSNLYDAFTNSFITLNSEREGCVDGGGGERKNDKEREMNQSSPPHHLPLSLGCDQEASRGTGTCGGEGEWVEEAQSMFKWYIYQLLRHDILHSGVWGGRGIWGGGGHSWFMRGDCFSPSCSCVSLMRRNSSKRLWPSPPCSPLPPLPLCLNHIFTLQTEGGREGMHLPIPSHQTPGEGGEGDGEGVGKGEGKL